MTEFSNSSRKRGKSARASFILRITHDLKSGVLVSSPNIYLSCYAGYLILESLGSFLWKRSLVPRVSPFRLVELGRAN